jgi:uncharacterized protein YgiM (DUF1202 family)
MDIGKLDERELSPASIRIQAKAADKSKMMATQPRDGNLCAKNAIETPTAKAATLKSENVVHLSMRVMPPNDPKLSHGAENRKRGFANKCKMQE